MNNQRILPALSAAFAMLTLILDSTMAIEAAREGIELCLRTLIPSLFPFFVVSTLLTGSLLGQSIRILRPVCCLLGIPQGAESLLAVGFLGGYPVGAQNVALAYKSGHIRKSEAQRLLSFCSNAGPAFLFGILGSIFSSRLTPWILWGIHIFSALIVGLLMSKPSVSSASVPAPRHSLSLTDALEQAVRTMAVVCGWVLIFRMIFGFLQRWILWMLPGWIQVFLSGILELSNGCIALGSLPSEGLRFLMASVFLPLGGLCVTMQTASVTKGLSLELYFRGKILQTCLSLLLSIPLQKHLPVSEQVKIPGVFAVMLLAAAFIFVVISQKAKKSVAFRNQLVYNHLIR